VAIVAAAGIDNITAESDESAVLALEIERNWRNRETLLNCALGNLVVIRER